MKLIALLISALFFQYDAQAASAGRGISSSPFRFGIGAISGIGSMKSEGGTVPSRNITSFGTWLSPAIFIDSFGLVAWAEYGVTAQNTDPASVSNTNTAGKGYLTGAGISYDFEFLRANLVYLAVGNYDLNKATASGEQVSYQKPVGLHLGLDFALDDTWVLNLFYRQISYTNTRVGATSTDISSDKLISSTGGAGISAAF